MVDIDVTGWLHEAEGIEHLTKIVGEACISEQAFALSGCSVRIDNNPTSIACCALEGLQYVRPQTELELWLPLLWHGRNEVSLNKRMDILYNVY